MTLTFHPAMSAKMPTKHLPLPTGGAFPRLLVYLRLPFHPQGTPPSGGAQHGWCSMSSRAIDAPDHSLSLPPEIDLSPVNNPGTPPEHLVDTVRNFGPFLSIWCKMLGQGDLKIFGTSPVDAGGFADIWVGERDDGTKVAIKSYRYYSSSSCLPIYLVSVQCNRNAFCPLKVAHRGCIGKQQHTAVSTTTAMLLYRLLGFIPLANTLSPSFLSLWINRTSESI
jgi:hypothetical protein